MQLVRSYIPISVRRNTNAMTTVATRTCVDDEKGKQQGRRTAAATAMERMRRAPSFEALAMAGCPCVPGEYYYCSDDDDDGGDGTPPVHLRAFEAFLEEVVPAGMVVASQREEEARLRRGGEPRSYDEDMKEKLKLWARAVAVKTAGIRS